MKKIMFGNSLMLLGIAIMILAGLKVIYVGTLWVSFLLIIVGFVMATIGFFGKDMNRSLYQRTSSQHSGNLLQRTKNGIAF